MDQNLSSRPAFRIRAITPDDATALAAFYAGLSQDSLEGRFHGAARGIGEATARFFCGPDHEHREGLVAEAVGAEGDTTIVGHLCLEPEDPHDVEMAVAVADAWQHHGIGRALLMEGIHWARGHGVDRMVASMRCGNASILGLVRAVGLPVIWVPSEAGVIDAVMDLGAAPDVTSHDAATPGTPVHGASVPAAA